MRALLCPREETPARESETVGARGRERMGERDSFSAENAENSSARLRDGGGASAKRVARHGGVGR